MSRMNREMITKLERKISRRAVNAVQENESLNALWDLISSGAEILVLKRCRGASEVWFLYSTADGRNHSFGILEDGSKLQYC